MHPADSEGEVMDVMDVTDVKGPRRGSAFHRTMRFVFSSHAGVCALGFLALLVAVSVFAPWLMPYDPNEQDLLNRLQGPSTEHWLGTDSLGRDTLSRLIAGTRVTLLAIATSVGLAVSLGIPTGLAAGFVGRRLDLVLSWVADILLALPALILTLGIVGILGPGLTNAMIAVGIVFAPGSSEWPGLCDRPTAGNLHRGCSSNWVLDAANFVAPCSAERERFASGAGVFHRRARGRCRIEPELSRPRCRASYCYMGQHSS